MSPPCTNSRGRLAAGSAIPGRRGALIWAMLAVLACLPALGATVDTLSLPAQGTWAVDTTGTLSPETLAAVNRLSTNLDASGQGQLAVAMVDSTEGVQPRSFATDLFNRWAIGHEDRDDGVLLFIAMTDRKVEIVLGDGVDTAGDLQRSDAVMERITPLLKAGDPNGAVIEGTRGLGTLLVQSSHNRGTTPASLEQDDDGSGSSQNSSGWLFYLILAGLFAGGVLGLNLLLGTRNRGGPSSGGGYFGGGYSGGGSSGGGGGGSSSGGGSSGSF